MSTIASANKAVSLVKETWLVRSIKFVLVLTVLSFIANAFFLGRQVATDNQLASNQKVIEAVLIENGKLKIEREVAMQNYLQTKAQLNAALIPEATFKEAVSKHVVLPVKDTAETTFSYAKDGANLMYENTKGIAASVTENVKAVSNKIWNHVQVF